MITLPDNFLANLIETGKGISSDVMPFVILFVSIPLATVIIEIIINAFATSGERKIERAVQGNLKDNELLTIAEWKEVYKRKGSEYKDWVSDTKVSQSEYLSTFNQSK